MRIADHLRGRDNNLNLLRALAASAVILSHSVVLLTGNVDLEFLRSSLGMSLGDIAVDIFFLVSGLLVTGSLAKKKDLKAYFLARVRRIYPGLMVMLLLVNIPLGLWLTSLPWLDYLSSPALIRNFFHNLILVVSAWTGLPGVMADAPWPHAINGSLWTLTYEIRLYIWLATCWAVSRLFKSRGNQAFGVAIFATWIAAFGAFLVAEDGYSGNPVPRLVLFFAAGMVLYVIREKVVLNWKWTLLVLAALVAAWFHGQAFRPAYGILMPYLILVLAYLPSGFIRGYNRLGDYSFGLYIYAFPIQQVLVFLRPDDSPIVHTCLALVLTMIPAWLSWNLVEKRFLHGR
jgi:peptidoglycan/LPS O-acetylase OafA/YrhL